MIVITRTPSSITVCGHANYAEHGKDIVCSAVSTLWQTLVLSLHGLTNTKIEHRQQKDIQSIKFENLTEHGQLLVDSFFIGVNGIAAAYPDNVTVVDYHEIIDQA